MTLMPLKNWSSTIRTIPSFAALTGAPSGAEISSPECWLRGWPFRMRLLPTAPVTVPSTGTRKLALHRRSAVKTFSAAARAAYETPTTASTHQNEVGIRNEAIRWQSRRITPRLTEDALARDLREKLFHTAVGRAEGIHAEDGLLPIAVELEVRPVHRVGAVLRAREPDEVSPHFRAGRLRRSC